MSSEIIWRDSLLSNHRRWWNWCHFGSHLPHRSASLKARDAFGKFLFFFFFAKVLFSIRTNTAANRHMRYSPSLWRFRSWQECWTGQDPFSVRVSVGEGIGVDGMVAD